MYNLFHNHLNPDKYKILLIVLNILLKTRFATVNVTELTSS